MVCTTLDPWAVQSKLTFYRPGGTSLCWRSRCWKLIAPCLLRNPCWCKFSTFLPSADIIMGNHVSAVSLCLIISPFSLQPICIPRPFLNQLSYNSFKNVEQYNWNENVTLICSNCLINCGYFSINQLKF